MAAALAGRHGEHGETQQLQVIVSCMRVSNDREFAQRELIAHVTRATSAAVFRKYSYKCKYVVRTRVRGIIWFWLSEETLKFDVQLQAV